MSRTTDLSLFLLTLGGASVLSGQTFRSDLPRAPMSGLGASLVVSGDEVFAGRPGEFAMFPMPASKPGAVVVFAQGDDGWRMTATIAPDDGTVGDQFGQSVAVDGNRMAVGAPRAAGGQGAVYVFERSGPGGPWNQRARLDASDGAPGHGFGSSVALVGDVLAVGAPGHAEGRGAAYRFAPTADGWRETAVLTGAAAGDAFGYAVALTADLLVVGAPGPQPFAPLGPPTPPRPGAAFLYHRLDDGWEEAARLEAQGSLMFGFAVALRDRDVFVSAPITGGAIGAIYRFGPKMTGWEEIEAIRPPADAGASMFGFSFAVSDTHLIVGRPFSQNGQGAATMYAHVGLAWEEMSTVTKPLTGMTIFLGNAVALAGNTAVVGAPGADFFEGVGIVYERSDAGTWEETGSLLDESVGLTALTGTQRDCTDGTVDAFACGDVDLLSFLPVADLGGQRGTIVNDVWGWTDSLTGKEYAIVGRSDGTTFIDLSDPVTPVYLGYLPLTETATINAWRDVKVYKNHAFVVADAAGQHGIQIFDLTQLRNVTNPPVTFDETAHYDGIFSAHNIVINEQTGFAYSVGSSSGGETCGGGLHMVDIREPANPTFAGCFADPSTGRASTGYSHDAQCIVYHGPDADYAGREICFGSNETALSIADVSDKTNPVAIATGQYPSVAYAHQGWVSDDHRHFYMNDEGDELVGGTPRTRTLVWDIEDLDDPVLLTEFMGVTRASDHNLYIRGNLMYQSNYVSGLRIIDISDPAQPVEVAYFDTVPTGEDVPGFAGSWSNYPYFDSGIIVVTSMREGVFILKKRDQTPIP